MLTFLCYTSYHLSRKPISIVKLGALRYGSRSGLIPGIQIPPPPFPFLLRRPLRGPKGAGGTGTSPSPDGDNYKELFGALDNAFLVAYAVGMFVSGIFGERLPLRYYLSSGMLLSGLFTALFGLGYFWNIHVLWYFIIIQICNGLVQTTGWPAVVACVGNWFGKGKRGLIMGIWNSHTSVGNILGSLIAGAWVSSAWGLSFVVPGVIIASVGLICFFFLVEHPEDVGCSPPLHHVSASMELLVLEFWCSSLPSPLMTPTFLSFQADPEEKEADGGAAEEGPPLSSSRASLEPKEGAEEPAAISFLGALRIPGVVEFSLCLLFAKLVSYTFLYWLPLYIVNVAHFGAKEAGDLSTLFDVGGILGGIIAGLVSDYTGGRATTCCVMLVVAAPMVGGVTPVALSPPAMLIVCGGLVNGPYALITTAVSADLGTHESLQGNAKALSTVTAIIDGTGSVGAALGPLLAGLISPTGWNNVFYMLITADVLACLVGARVPARGRDLGWYCGLSFSGDDPNPPGCSLCHVALLEQEGWTRRSPELPSTLNPSIPCPPQLLSRVVLKELRGWCGSMARKRG
uniref:Solute carrier family 37 member 2 n=1 Tax=Nothoprocta perdicaria TaxID=30464 RepID=A0A8C6YNH3_NOTPE